MYIEGNRKTAEKCAALKACKILHEKNLIGNTPEKKLKKRKSQDSIDPINISSNNGKLFNLLFIIFLFYFLNF